MSDKAKNIVIIICLILIFLMGGYLVYDRLIKDKPIEDNQTVEVEPTDDQTVEIEPTKEIIADKTFGKNNDGMLTYTRVFEDLTINNHKHNLKLVTVQNPQDDKEIFSANLMVYIDNELVKTIEKIYIIEYTVDDTLEEFFKAHCDEENNAFVMGNLIVFNYHFDEDRFYFFNINGKYIGKLENFNGNITAYTFPNDKKSYDSYEFDGNSFIYWTHDKNAHIKDGKYQIKKVKFEVVDENILITTIETKLGYISGSELPVGYWTPAK